MIELKCDSQDNLRIVRLIGDVSLASIPQLVDRLNRELINISSNIFVLDLDGVDVLDDAGIGILMGFAARARQAETRVFAIASIDRIATRLATTRFDRAVDVVSSVTAIPRSAR